MLNYAAQGRKKALENRSEQNLKPGAEYLSGLKKTDKLIVIEDGGADMCESLERKYKEKEQKVAELYNYLWENGRREDGKRATRDPDFRKKLMKELEPVLTLAE